MSVFPLYVRAVTGATVHCVDFDPAILLLKSYAVKCGLARSLEDASLTIQCLKKSALPYPDESFHRISCVSTIEHSPEDSDTSTMLDIVRIVKRGGLMAFSVPINKTHTDVYVESAVYNREYEG